MKCIITVLGSDKVGIIAKICTYLAEKEINVLDISQTIVKGYFNMMMIVEITKEIQTTKEISNKLTQIGNELGVVITIQNEDIFNCMHRI
ncbi:MAG: ACT domain-containing protein [Fusobacterium sp. JB021]|nr:ACT domain-containing protein [Fusobacterium sp. JB021]MDP0506980.1 ACT domain-containing protein [Fusobacterium sp. JB019]